MKTMKYMFCTGFNS